MSRRVKRASVAIVKTASGSVAFTAARTRDSIMEGQDELVAHELDDADVDSREDCEEDLADVGRDADVYVASHQSKDSIHEARVGDALLAFNGSSQDLLQLRSLSLD